MKKTIQDWKELRREWLQDTGYRLERVLLVCVVLTFIFSLTPFCDLLLSIPIEALIGITAAALAVAIPLAILIIDSKSSGVKFALDQQVGVEKVFKIAFLLTTFMVLIIPSILLWNYSRTYGQPVLRPTLLVIFGLGIFLIILIMRSTYIWLSTTERRGADNYINRKRLEYIEVMHNDNWSVVWQDIQGRELIGDKRLIQKFFDRLEILAKNKEKDEKYEGIPVLQSLIKQFDTLDLQNPHIYERLIDFALKGTSTRTGDKIDNPYYETFASGPRDLFRRIARRSLDNNGFLAHMFFENIQKFPWVEQNVDQNKVIKVMTYDFFKNLEDRGRVYNYSTVWERFPRVWLITSQNLKNQDNPFAWAWFIQYWRWIVERCYVDNNRDEKLNIDDVAEDVTRNLLPKIDPVTWSTILTFQLVPINENLDEKELVRVRIQEFIQRTERFGFVSSSFSTPVTNIDDMEREHKREIKKQQGEVFKINKIIKICPILLDVNKIDEYLAFAEQLKDYESKSIEEYRRIKIIRILDAAKQWLLESNK